VVKNHQHNSGSSGWQAEIRGGGSLDEDGEHNIGFYLRGPDITDKSSFGSQDEYWFSYWNKDFSLHLGDKYYTLSPLTESGRYGFGADVKYWRGDLQLHAYHMRERFASSETEQLQQSALSARYAIDDSSRIHLNYLNKQQGDDNQHLLSLRGELNRSPALNLDMEYALSQSRSDSGQAGRGYLSGTYGDFRYVATLLHADPNFQGYYQDQQYAALELSYAATEFWGIVGDGAPEAAGSRSAEQPASTPAPLARPAPRRVRRFGEITGPWCPAGAPGRQETLDGPDRVTAWGRTTRT
jgi:hypothetical protein